MYGVGDFAGGRRVNGRAVYEEAIGVGDDGFGERGLKDLPEDIVDVGGFGEDGDSCFLWGRELAFTPDLHIVYIANSTEKPRKASA